MDLKIGVVSDLHRFPYNLKAIGRVFGENEVDLVVYNGDAGDSSRMIASGFKYLSEGLREAGSDAVIKYIPGSHESVQDIADAKRAIDISNLEIISGFKREDHDSGELIFVPGGRSLVGHGNYLADDVGVPAGLYIQEDESLKPINESDVNLQSLEYRRSWN